MSFVGQVNRIDDTFVRPHDLELTLELNGLTREALVERVLYLGFEVRVELVREDGERISVQITRDEEARLEIEAGQIIFGSFRRGRSRSHAAAGGRSGVRSRPLLVRPPRSGANSAGSSSTCTSPSRNGGPGDRAAPRPRHKARAPRRCRAGRRWSAGGGAPVHRLSRARGELRARRRALLRSGSSTLAPWPTSGWPSSSIVPAWPGRLR